MTPIIWTTSYILDRLMQLKSIIYSNMAAQKTTL